MKPKRGYRGVEFGLWALDGGKTKWTFYPKKGDGMAQSGVSMGGDVEAEAACKKAIDAWLDGNTPNWDTTLKSDQFKKLGISAQINSRIRKQMGKIPVLESELCTLLPHRNGAVEELGCLAIRRKSGQMDYVGLSSLPVAPLRQAIQKFGNEYPATGEAQQFLDAMHDWVVPEVDNQW